MRLAPENGVVVTPRQVQVLRLLEQGFTDKEIAAELQIGYRTVRTHLELLYTKFGVSTRTGLVGAWRRPIMSAALARGEGR